MGSTTITVGPWGGSGGNEWDDGVYDGIREITIFSGVSIVSITTEYDQNGVPIIVPTHGGNGGTINTIKLDFPDEHIVNASGHFENVTSHPTPVVTSLKFVTNKGEVFGPYGTEQGTAFSLPIKDGKIIGFIGRSGDLIDAIGFRLSPNN